MQLSKVATKTISKYFEKQRIVEISLFDIMDLFIAKNIKDHKSLFEAMPVFRLKNIGLKTIIHIVSKVSSGNCGMHFKQEWIKRKTELIKYLKNNKFTYLYKRIN